MIATVQNPNEDQTREAKAQKMQTSGMSKRNPTIQSSWCCCLLPSCSRAHCHKPSPELGHDSSRKSSDENDGGRRRRDCAAVEINIVSMLLRYLCPSRLQWLQPSACLSCKGLLASLACKGINQAAPPPCAPPVLCSSLVLETLTRDSYKRGEPTLTREASSYARGEQTGRVSYTAES